MILKSYNFFQALHFFIVGNRLDTERYVLDKKVANKQTNRSDDEDDKIVYTMK